MNRNPPSLRRHASGQWFCRWGGQDRYLGHDATKAQQAYLVSLSEWAAWRADRDGKQQSARTKQVPTVVELSAMFMSQKEAEGGKERRRYYQNHLRRFVGIYRNVAADKVRPADVNALKLDMLRSGFRPRNIQHDLSAVKGMFRWAAALEIVPPVNLDVIHAPESDPVPDKSYSPAEVWSVFWFLPDHIANWVATQYLALMRPSEIVRVVAGCGEWEQPWLFRLDSSKMSWRTKEHRRIVFSDSAISFLRCCEPRWTRYDTYYQAVYRYTAGTDFAFFSPHPLRHSGATHLAQAGVSRLDIDLLLGHLPGRVSRIYNRIDWASLRQPVSRIAAETVR